MNLTRAQSRGLIEVGGAVFGISGAYRNLRKARGNADKLALLDAVISLLAVLTGLAVAVRAFRSSGRDA